MNRTLSGDVQFHGGELGISQCVWCRHRAPGGRRCRAYPDGIPEAISDNRHDHRQPYRGDGGVRFEPEQVEIEFVGVDDGAAAAPAALELAMAQAGARTARTAPEGSSDVGAEVIPLDGPELELDGDVFELDDTATG